MPRRRLRRSLLDLALAPDLGPAFTRLWSASAVSNLGDGALLAAGPLLVASISHRPVAVAMAVFAQTLPWLLFALVSGAVVDRLDRRRLIVVVDSCRGLALAAMTTAVAAGHATLWSLYATLFVLGIGETLADSAAGALVATTVPGAALGRANARLYATFTLGNQLAGPPLGALLFAAGASLPLGLDAASFVLAATILSRMRPPGGTAGPDPGGVADAGRRWLWHDISEGVAWLARHPALRTLSACILVMNLTFGAAFATWVLFARERLGVTQTQFGLLVTAGAVGGLAGPAVYRRLEQRAGVPVLLRAGLVIETLTHVVLAVTRSGIVVGVTMSVFGVHAMVWGTAATTARQRSTPPNLLGRVAGVYGLLSVTGTSVGTVAGGFIAQSAGLVAPFWMAFGAMALATAAAWRPLRHTGRR